MNDEQIIVEIDPKGNTKVSVKNVKGPSCKALTKDIESALGETVEDTKTPEYNEVAPKHAQRRTAGH